MATPLDVLVIQSQPRAADDAMAALREAGHRVHDCYDPDSKGFPCKGLVEPDGCPIDRGVDVALLVRNRIQPRPTSLENGAICAIRAGVPLTEQGSSALDPFEPWVTSRVENHHDVVEACEAAVVQTAEPLQQEILTQATALLAQAGKPVGDLSCTVQRIDSRLLVRLSGPDLDRRLQQALALRVLSVVQRSGKAANPLDVHYAITATTTTA